MSDISSHHPDQGSPEDRFGFVSEWLDGATMLPADPVEELVGRKLILASRGSSPVRHGWQQYSPFPNQDERTGFLFLGDDGESVWFALENDSLAFRMERSCGDSLLRQLDQDACRLVCQGALVYCYMSTSAGSGIPSIRFPESAAAA